MVPKFGLIEIDRGKASMRKHVLKRAEKDYARTFQHVQSFLLPSLPPSTTHTIVIAGIYYYYYICM